MWDMATRAIARIAEQRLPTGFRHTECGTSASKAGHSKAESGKPGGSMTQKQRRVGSGTFGSKVGHGNAERADARRPKESGTWESNVGHAGQMPNQHASSC